MIIEMTLDEQREKVWELSSLMFSKIIAGKAGKCSEAELLAAISHTQRAATMFVNEFESIEYYDEEDEEENDCD